MTTLSAKELIQLLLVALAVIGVVSVGSYNILPSNVIFELLFLFTVLGTSYRAQPSHILLGLVVMCYLIALVLKGIMLNGVDPRDFLTANKFLIYFSILLWLKPSKEVGKIDIEKLYNLLLALFLIKYLYSVITGLDTRPGIYTENNYELIFLLILFVARHFYMGSSSLLIIAITGFVFFLSGSRSSFAALLAVLFLLNSGKLNAKKMVFYLVFFLMALGFAYVFMARLGGGGLEDIDRFKFLLAFYQQIEDWNYLNWLFGTPVLTPLDNGVCGILSFYQSLFSHTGNGTCYSVIFHSYILRVLFDHGVIILLATFYITYALLKASGFPAKGSRVIVLIVFMSALSVSSLNNAYTILGIWFAMSVGANIRNRSKNEH